MGEKGKKKLGKRKGKEDIMKKMLNRPNIRKKKRQRSYG